MKKNWKVFLFAGVILIALAALYIVSYLAGRIPSNAISVTGNTAGNLNNNGLFAENQGVVYFSNAYDNGCLYSMNADETNLQKLTTSQVSSINTDDHFVYYYMDSLSGGTGLGYIVRTYGIFRSSHDGTDSKCLDRNMVVTMQLVGDYLYYQRYTNQDFTRFYKVKTDKSDNVQVSESIINPAACHDGILYFNGTDKDHYLYALDTRTDVISLLYEGNLWYPAYQEGYIYYMDVSENYRLCRYHLADAAVEVLTNDRVDTFNVGEQFIYYQKNSATDPALMRMELDGSNPELVAQGNYSNINLTSAYAYFSAFGQEVPVYHTPVNGPVSVSPFTAAREATAASLNP